MHETTVPETWTTTSTREDNLSSAQGISFVDPTTIMKEEQSKSYLSLKEEEEEETQAELGLVDQSEGFSVRAHSPSTLGSSIAQCSPNKTTEGDDETKKDNSLSFQMSNQESWKSTHSEGKLNNSINEEQGQDKV